MKTTKPTLDTTLNRISKDKNVRREVTKKIFFYFFHIYFSHYIKYSTANFQKEIMGYLEQKIKYLVVTSFRGSGKSTVVTTAYPIWAILGDQGIKFVLIVCQTKAQAKQHMMNLRRELEDNLLLKKDLGPFKEEPDEWGAGSLVFSNCDARITVVSTEQSVRGLRHNQFRPQIILCDDLEDLSTVKTYENRQKLYEWFFGDLVPCGDINTKIILVGNKLHDDSLLMRIKDKIYNQELSGIYKEYPLVTSRGECIWPSKFPNEESLKQLKQTIGNEVSWQREFLLKIISNEDQIIKNEWIQYYESIPDLGLEEYYASGIDLAISQKEHADYTAMVTAKVIGYRDTLQVYILSNVVNKRMTSEETIQQACFISETHPYCQLFLEDNGFQSIFTERLSSMGVDATGVTTVSDKQSRLKAISFLLESKKVFFPKEGCKELIQQLLGFGREKHDDLADAFSLLLSQIAKEDSKSRCRPVLVNLID